MAGHGRVIIVGGGVVGLCCAYYARTAGFEVTLLERGAPDHDSCSRGNAGMVVPSHFVPLAAPGMVSYGLRMMLSPSSPFYVKPRLDPDLIRWGLLFQSRANAAHVAKASPVLARMHLESRACYEDLAAIFKEDFDLTKRGLLMLCKQERVLEHEAKLVPRAHALGIEAELLNADQTARLDPGIKMDIAGSVYFPLDCHFDPSAFVDRLTKEVIDIGVDIQWNSELISWNTSSSGEIYSIATRNSYYSGDQYVLAAGSWSTEVAKKLKLSIPMQAGKGYSVTVDKPKQLPRLCSILTEARVAVTPMGSALRFGGTMEVTGLDESIDKRRVQGILKAIPEYFPEFSSEDYTSLPVWRGLRPCSPDGLPYIGRPLKNKNLIVATGHAMMGMSLGPITGKTVTALLEYKAPSIDLTMLDVNRFG